MRTWSSNVPGFKKIVSSKDLDKNQTQKVLGITWLLREDVLELSFKKTIAPKGKVPKLLILARLAQNYDSLGSLSPVNLKAKLLVQSLWEQSFKWDKKLLQEVEEE